MQESIASNLRVISLIPSATEIVAALGKTTSIVGRSHECDYPAEVQTLPICTAPKFSPDGTSQEIHEKVDTLLQSALSVYRVETDLLKTLRPTHIITQAQCEVCAVSLSDVEQAIARLTEEPPKLLSLQPTVLADLWSDIRQVGDALGVDSTSLLQHLQQRVQACQDYVKHLPKSDRPTVVCVEWIEPLMAAGNWVPELVELAGGRSLLGTIGQHSPWITFEQLKALDPDYLIYMPCGFDREKTEQEARQQIQQAEWQQLTAVQKGQVFAVDGNQYFNRPGPRLVDSLEILLEILHQHTPKSHKGSGWQPLGNGSL